MKDYRENYADDYRDDDSDRAFVEFLAKLCQRDEEGIFVPVEPRIELVKKFFQVTKLIFQGADTAKLKFNTPFHGMGVISLDGRNLKYSRHEEPRSYAVISVKELALTYMVMQVYII